MCYGLDRTEQTEFMTMLMRYGYRGNSLNSLLRMVKTVNAYKKKLKLANLPQETLIIYGKKIIDFLEFLTLIPQLRNIPHFILNWNSANTVKYCIFSIQKLERLYLLAKRREDNCLFDCHEIYIHNITQLTKTHNWNHKDDYILLSSVLDHGFNNYRRISNSLRWLKTSPKVIEYAERKGVLPEPHKVLKEMEYKMAWE